MRVAGLSSVNCFTSTSLEETNTIESYWIMESRETTFLFNAAFLAAIYIDSKCQLLFKYSQKTVAQAHLAAF